MKWRLLLLLIFIASNAIKAQEVTHSHSVHHAFIENKGQWPDHVFFMNRFGSGNMWVEDGRVLFHLQDYDRMNDAHFNRSSVGDSSLYFKQEVINLHFEGANPIEDVERKQPTEHYYNYHIGKKREKWTSEVRGYNEFTLKSVYDAIDVRFIEQEREIKYEFVVAPGADPNAIRMKYANQKKLAIDDDGNLQIEGELGVIKEQEPYAYQIVNGQIREIGCSFQLDGDEVTFELDEFNERVELIIDPTLVFATYCGAISDNFGMSATYGYDGTAYNAGMVYGNDYPMPDGSAYDVNSNMTVADVGVATTDAFISKYSPDGETMLWSTFFGGGDNTQGTDVPHSLICDRDNNVYAYGVTSSQDFPVVNGFQTAHAGGDPLSINFNGTDFGNAGTDIFVAKFSENGQNLMGSTYVGGAGNDGVNYLISGGNYNSVNAYDSLTTNYGDQFRGEIMLDSVNNILVGSCTRSSDFPTANPFQPTTGGQSDGVVFKIENDFSALQWSSFYGGTENDAVYSVKVDSSANIVFAGGTSSSDLPNTAGAYQAAYGGGETDGFIGKLTPDGQTLTQSTYLGMADYDQVFFVEIDRLDNVFVVGQSNGGNFPVVNASYSNPNSSQFIAKLTPDLSTLEGSTVFGSGSTTFDISPSAFLVDICGNMYVSGWGANILQSNPVSGLPVTSDAFQQTPPNGFDFYLIVIERDFNSLLYGTYMGGAASDEHVDGGTSRFDKNGVVYQGVCGGCGGNSDFPTTPDAWSDQNLADNCNALVFKFDFNLIPNADFSVENNVGCAPFEVTFDNFSSQSDSYVWDFGNGDLDSTTFEPTVNYSTPGTYDVFLYVTDSVCLITDTAQITIEVTPEIDLDAIPPVSLCNPETLNFTANSNGTATSFVWSSDSNLSDTLNSDLTDSTVTIPDPESGYYYFQASNAGCSVMDSVEVDFTSASINLTGTSNLCLGDEVIITAESDTSGITFSGYDWSADSIIVSGDGTNTVVVNPEETQYLYLSATASNGCQVEDSIMLSVSAIDETLVNAEASDENVPYGTTVTLDATPSGYNYIWQPVNAVDDPNQQTTTAYMEETTEFTVLVSDGICTKEAAVIVEVFEFVCDEPFVFVPNAFSPNGDQENDVLYVRSDIVEEVVFRIYNRWGELVFETTDMSKGWDGTYKGKPMDPDVYDYYLDGYCIDGQSFLIQGNVTLIR
ncbi:MAG: gliding motility-associated C-terminal domain-containing protein [Bacteroidota bacterium]